jgi:DNA repair exonuclease SbcCD ATPase subunit
MSNDSDPVSAHASGTNPDGESHRTLGSSDGVEDEPEDRESAEVGVPSYPETHSKSDDDSEEDGTDTSSSERTEIPHREDDPKEDEDREENGTDTSSSDDPSRPEGERFEHSIEVLTEALKSVSEQIESSSEPIRSEQSREYVQRDRDGRYQADTLFQIRNRIHDLDDRLAELRNEQEQQANQVSEELDGLRNKQERQAHEVSDEVQLLSDRLETLDDQLAELRDKQEQQADQLSEELDELRDKQKQQIDQVSNEVQLLSGRLETLGDRLDDAASSSALESLSERTDEELESVHHRTAELEAEVRETRSEHEAFEATIEEEFDGIESVFERLFEDIEDIEAELETLRSSYGDDMHALQQQNRRQKRLAELKKRAATIGVTKASCENCDETVNIGLLETPRCPHCEQSCTELSKGSSWNPFSSPVLHTEPNEAGPLGGEATEFAEDIGPSDDRSSTDP